LMISISGWVMGGPYRQCILAITFRDNPRKNNPMIPAKNMVKIISSIVTTMVSNLIEQRLEVPETV